jgi:hypothetical protein
VQQNVLNATAAFWRTPGRIDAASFAATYQALKQQGLLGLDYDVTESYTNDYVP